MVLGSRGGRGRTRWAGAAWALLGFCGGAPAAAEGLEKGLNDHYKVATIGVRENGDTMLHPGTILEVRAEGIVSFGEKDASYAELCPSEVRAGAIRTPKNSACNSLAPKRDRKSVV